MMLSFIVLITFFYINGEDPIPVNIWNASFLIGIAIIYAVGIVDDLTGLKASSKFAAQIAVACLLPLSGLYVNNLYGLFGIYEIPYIIGAPLTVLLIVYIDNAINLIDGIDGLASGLSLFAFTGFLAYFVYYDVFMQTYSIIICGMIGALIAFMFFNLFGKAKNNTKIFMGDSGSLTLGFSLGFLTIKCAMDNTAIWPTRPEAIMIPISLLFVSCADVVRVTLYRLRHHYPIFDADKNHIHHKLMRAGMSQHQALVSILLLAAFFAILNYMLHGTLTQTWILFIDSVIYCIINMCINQYINSMYLKRAFDCVTAFACLILFSPLMLTCFLAIKLGGGPAIYKQERIGLAGKPFYIYKFRTMRTDAEKDGEMLYQHENEDRMTKIGKQLRRHHIDELPQLWNVFVGDMSFVGYRPERPYYIKQIMERDARYEKMYQIRPGVTSYATLNNGYTDTIEKMLKRLEYDLYYLEHQSLLMDMKILWVTFVRIISGKIF
ncbi:sugar transferase [Prevotella sp. P6B1]|uniref:sugar transferase n=1 Tax=Prevotella sp. P6B1 TaxID=1410613 RepID=UPI000AE4CE4B|nr:sugar transferase [Prevotella sp. P6B1]